MSTARRGRGSGHSPRKHWWGTRCSILPHPPSAQPMSPGPCAGDIRLGERGLCCQRVCHLAETEKGAGEILPIIMKNSQCYENLGRSENTAQSSCCCSHSRGLAGATARAKAKRRTARTAAGTWPRQKRWQGMGWNGNLQCHVRTDGCILQMTHGTDGCIPELTGH